MASFPDPTAHGLIEPVFPDLFVVRGCIVGRGMVFPRNMTILRSGRELTLFNAVRLSPEGEAQLTELGDVTHLVKLGAFHGLDDPYYADRFSPTLWAPPGSSHKGGLSTDRELCDDSTAFTADCDAQVFSFKATAEPEAAVRVGHGGGTLITCDSITNLVDAADSQGCEKIITAENGFLRQASIGIFWRNRMRSDTGQPLVHDYQRLLELPFSNLVTAHGPPLLGDAKRAITETLRYLYKLTIEVQDS